VLVGIVAAVYIFYTDDCVNMRAGSSIH